jgi:hypothetical protein
VRPLGEGAGCAPGSQTASQPLFWGMPPSKKIAAARKAAKLRNWRAWLLRQRAQPLGTVEATDERTAADCVGCHGQQAATHLAMVENDRLTTWNRAPRSDIFRCVRPRRSTSWVSHTRTWEALVSWPIRGLSLGCYSRASSARERQHGDEAGGDDNRGLQI